MKKVIYKNEFTLDNLFLGPNNYGSLTILTYIVKETIWFVKKYKIRQEIPLCKDPFYDGEYTTNNILKRYARTEYVKAQLFLDELKNEK